jgi:small subunit ribosomal protein S18
MPFATRKPATAATAAANRKPKAVFSRKKNCFFCLNPEFEPDYKDTARLRRYINERNRIIGQSKTRTCASHQRAIATSIRQARTMALIV